MTKYFYKWLKKQNYRPFFVFVNTSEAEQVAETIVFFAQMNESKWEATAVGFRQKINTITDLLILISYV